MIDRYILLVEDSPDDVVLTKIAFQKCQLGFNLIVARDGEEALDYLFNRGEYASRHKDNPAAILLDLKLPRLSGQEVLREIRANPMTSSIPVIILSTSISEKETRESLALGANQFYRKPIALDQFVEIIRQIKSSWLDSDQSSQPQQDKQ